MKAFTPELQVTIARVRDEVVSVHDELARTSSPVGAAGTVSERVPGADLFVITPLNSEAAGQSPENQLLCDLDGNVIPDIPGADAGASDEAATHAFVYRSLPGITGIALFASP